MPDRHQLHASYCDGHQKRLYGSRNDAKGAIRRQHDKGMRAYLCELVAGHWHIGHLPKDVLKGRVTAAEIYGGRS
ncbi:hypothetical protein [Micromonospora sp. KC213]|uniref:hypothetical protein n=1 Tax=Micromonospora sp. KC213 TaxID=2530378 RepID=UPI001051056C|nr:hypothetical protein [Micromonospora sp. KC213]TDC33119.1 hypothetical protein E1166_26065 [Micromonospora sp. KC213]